MVAILANKEARVLNNKHVLITRPLGQEGDILNALEQAGWAAWHQPLLSILPIQESAEHFHALKHTMMNIDLYDVIITVSANASSLAFDWIDRYWPQLPVGINWFAVGPSSAKALLPLGLDIHLPNGNHSEGLLELEDLQNMSDKKVLILRGVGGRELLAQELTKRGATVDYAELYERKAVDISQVQLDALLCQQQIHYAVVTSGEMAKQLAHGLNKKNKHDLALLVPSQRIKNMVLDDGFKQVHVCPEFSSQVIIQELNQLQRNS